VQERELFVAQSGVRDYDLKDVLIVVEEVQESLYLASRNLHRVDVRDIQGVDPVSLIGFDKV